DYFDSSDARVKGAVLGQWGNVFPSAYTEYIVLPATGAVTPLPRMILPGPTRTVQRFIDKWFAVPQSVPLPATDPDRLNWYGYLVPPNHQLVLTADTDSLDVTMSAANGFLSNGIDGELASVLNRGTVEQRVTDSRSGMYGADVDTLLSRTLAHEITHQWWVNDAVFGLSDHCHPQVAYTSSAPYPAGAGPLPAGLQFCLMSAASQAPSMPAPWDSTLMINAVEYQYRTGQTAFHVTQRGGNTWHSEYLEIRKRPDPWRP
ncbi:MAG TPA: hypothetical protein VNL91_09900, partial [Thermoanaerobaculia bacterium]|nr:hypothetical protein [Thermoanaerobaculia bacterium]